jgi:hypothetical protein
VQFERSALVRIFWPAHPAPPELGDAFAGVLGELEAGELAPDTQDRENRARAVREDLQDGSQRNKPHGPTLGTCPAAAWARKRVTSPLALATSKATKWPSLPVAGPYWRTADVSVPVVRLAP